MILILANVISINILTIKQRNKKKKETIDQKTTESL